MADFSVLIPHIHTPLDIRALRVALDTLQRHTVHDYELIVQAHHGAEAFTPWNAMARAATSDWLVFSVSDHFFSPGWDVLLWDARDENVLVMGTLIESGYRPVSDQCIERNFGFSPETFDEAGFNAFAASKPKPPTVEGWVWPWIISKRQFLDLGGFATHPSLSDMFFFRRWIQAGKSWKRVESYCYHLQCWNSTGNER